MGVKYTYLATDLFFLNVGEENLATLEEFIPSPEINGYRNKCEFTIGRHPETSQPIVGFRLASYKYVIK